MSIKKTSSPLSGGSEALDQLGGKDETKRGGKVDKTFEAALAEVAGEIEQAGGNEKAGSPAQTAFREIAANANLGTADGALAAVRESAHYLVNSRLDDEYKDSEQGKKISEDLSEYIAKDPFLNKKLLGILQRLK